MFDLVVIVEQEKLSRGDKFEENLSKVKKCMESSASIHLGDSLRSTEIHFFYYLRNQHRRYFWIVMQLGEKPVCGFVYFYC